MQVLKDIDFDNIKQTVYLDHNSPHGGVKLSKDWVTKSGLGHSESILTPVPDKGLFIYSRFSDIDYVYIRQYIPEVLKYSGKELDIEIFVDVLSEAAMYDLYIQARTSDNNLDRVLVADTPQEPLEKGMHRIRSTVVVPSLDNIEIDPEERISFAFRLNGKNEESIAVIIKSITVLCQLDDDIEADRYEEVSWIRKLYRKVLRLWK